MNVMQIRKITKLPGDTSPLVASDIPSPRPGDMEVLIGVSVCGICHTILMKSKGGRRPPGFPSFRGIRLSGGSWRRGVP